VKIIYILNNLNRISPNTVIFNILKKSDKNNIEVISLNKSSEDNYKLNLEQLGITYFEFSSLPRAILCLKKVRKKYSDVDVFHLNGYHANIFGFFLNRTNRKIIKLVSTCHSVESQEIDSYNFQGIKFAKAKLKLKLNQFFYKRHNTVVAVSRQVEKYLYSFGCQNVKTVYNGIDYANFPVILDKSSDNMINLCQVGHITRLKNQMYSLKLVCHLKSKGMSVKMHFFGSPHLQTDYMDLLGNYIKENKLENDVIFYGNLPFSSLFEKLNKMDVYLMPSLSEGLPLALIEAFYYRLPAIVSNNGGMKEVVINYENGLVIDIDDEKELEKIHEYIMSDFIIDNGINARHLALNEFSSERMVNEYIEIYHS
jgi:glycosyltransferase involved in cell wall biosynthesis